MSEETYAQRNVILRQLGFRTYWQYLQSRLWRSIRSRFWRSHPPICLVCKKPGYQLHHTSYTKEVLLGKDLSKLVPICRKCHRKIETVRGRKLTLAEANQRLSDLLPPTYVPQPLWE
jgi:5-methylcytosine-specific restriction endonuclease McrA